MFYPSYQNGGKHREASRREKMPQESIAHLFKFGLSPSIKVSFYLVQRKPFRNDIKILFYFILKALFVLKIFKFLSSHFGHVEETT